MLLFNQPFFQPTTHSASVIQYFFMLVFKVILLCLHKNAVFLFPADIRESWFIQSHQSFYICVCILWCTGSDVICVSSSSGLFPLKRAQTSKRLSTTGTSTPSTENPRKRYHSTSHSAWLTGKVGKQHAKSPQWWVLSTIDVAGMKRKKILWTTTLL